jgi:hypothetical protein
MAQCSDTCVSPQMALQLTADSIVFETSGLRISKGLSLKRWEDIGGYLGAAANSTSWWIADWLVYGEDAFPDRYAQATAKTALNYQTLRNYSLVARRFDLSRRHDQLSFSHHAEVAALNPPEQDYWLRQAEEQTWSRGRLRKEVRASLRERGLLSSAADAVKNGAHHVASARISLPLRGPQQDRSPTPAVVLSLPLTDDQYERCRDAAECRGWSVEEWAVQTLLRNS